jgi:Kef-type K+ transport system membrane component KefB
MLGGHLFRPVRSREILPGRARCLDLESVSMPSEALPAVPGSEVAYVVLLFFLFVLPKALQRWRIPGAITSFGLGAGAGIGLGLFKNDLTVSLLAALGISALFLFAGLEANLLELRKEARVLAQHVLARLGALGLFTLAIEGAFGLSRRPAVLVALALLTPSTGFIIDSIDALGLSGRERFWVRSKAVATELVALGTLFVVLQSTTAARLAISGVVLAGLILVLPLLFWAFASWIVPHAPKSEFAFLLMIALVSAFATKKLGVYYLVGAFVTGMIAQRFRERLPAMTSERMLHAVEVFASVFVPFYFFSAGLHLQKDDFSWTALLVGAAFLATAVPFRLGLTLVHRRFALGEKFETGLRISISMLPTLVFTLVLAQILRERFAVPSFVFGGLVLYALVNTSLPALFLRMPPPEFDTPDLPEMASPRDQIDRK